VKPTRNEKETDTMSQDETDYKHYMDSVESIADEVIEREKNGDDLGDAMHEAIDGSWWIIYNHAALAVMQHTRNDDYGLDEGLVDLSSSKDQSFASVVQQFAFWAMYADVLDALDDARERWEAAHPEPEEEEEEKVSTES
jgi:hypothetical protein